VGAGYCGLSAARTLAKRGVKVAVFEAETFGWGASSRNGGMVLTGMKLPVHTLIKRYGREAVRKMYAASLATIDCVEHIVREENIDCNFSRCGHLEVACKQAHFDGYEESAALLQREFSHKMRIVPRRQLRGEIGSDLYFGGMVDELSPRNRMIYDSNHFLYYYRLTPDNRMLFGGRAAFFPETENTVRRSAEILRLGMIGVYPQLRDTKIEFVWGGTLDFTLDVMPHAGKIDGMYFAAGFAGHGVAAATWFGAKLAGLICGDPNDMPFDGIKFLAAPPGLRSGNTWALPLAGAWYKILDFFM